MITPMSEAQPHHKSLWTVGCKLAGYFSGLLVGLPRVTADFKIGTKIRIRVQGDLRDLCARRIRCGAAPVTPYHRQAGRGAANRGVTKLDLRASPRCRSACVGFGRGRRAPVSSS